MQKRERLQRKRLNRKNKDFEALWEKATGYFFRGKLFPFLHKCKVEFLKSFEKFFIRWDKCKKDFPESLPLSGGNYSKMEFRVGYDAIKGMYKILNFV